VKTKALAILALVAVALLLDVGCAQVRRLILDELDDRHEPAAQVVRPKFRVAMPTPRWSEDGWQPEPRVSVR